MAFGVYVERVVGTGLHAGLTADAAALVEVYDTVFAVVQRFHWTDFHAGRVGAMVAAHHRKQAARIGEDPFFDLFHPGPVDPQGDVVFCLTGGGAGMAANALSVVYDKPVLHTLWLWLLSLSYISLIKRLYRLLYTEKQALFRDVTQDSEGL